MGMAETSSEKQCSTFSSLTEEPRPTKCCIVELNTQLEHGISALFSINKLLLDQLEGITVAKDTINNHVVQSISAINPERIKTLADPLLQDEAKVWKKVADQLANFVSTAFTQVNKMHDMGYTDYSEQLDKIDSLEKALESKDALIARLRKAENVSLWVKEKERILKEHNEKISVLEEEKLEGERQRDMLKKKFAETSEDLRVEKMKYSISRRKSSVAALDDTELSQLEELKKRVFLYEKDLQYGQQEVNRFQTDSLGLWTGLQADLTVLKDSIEDKTTALRLDYLIGVVNRIKSAVAGETDIRVVRADLSEKYLPGSGNQAVKPLHLRRFSKNVSTPTVPEGSTGSPALVRGAITKNGQKNNSSNKTIAPANLPSSASHTHAATGVVNPKLIIGEGGTLNTLAVIKHFPTLSAAYVKKQWENFKHYDADNNGELDLSEILAAFTMVMPKTTKPEHIEAALHEIDSDSSGTVDFYEYLKLALLLEKKAGKSQLFHEPDLQQNGKQLSKLCSIQ